MQFQDSEKSYQALRQLESSGQLSPRAFAEKVHALRLQTHDGSWWQIHPADGSWLCWNGTAWLPATPPPAVPQPAAQPPGLGGEIAVSVATTGVSLLKQLPRRILRQFFWRLPVVILTFLSVWVAHTYLLVVRNEGFNPDTWVGQWLNTAGNSHSATLIWGMGAALFWSAVISMFRVGPVKTISGLVLGPFRTLGMAFQGGRGGLGGFALGSGLGLWLADRFALNWQACSVLTATWLFVGTGYPGQLLARLCSDLWAQVFAKRTPQSWHSIRGIFQSLIAGLAPGFLLAAVLARESEAWRGRLVGPLLLGAVVLLFLKGKSPAQPPPAAPPGSSGAAAGAATIAETMVALLAWLTPTALFTLLGGWFCSSTAYADDGGWSEAVQSNDLTWANIIKWWNSPGAGRAIATGITPATSAAAAAVLTPPLAAPTDGVLILDDVNWVHQTKDGDTYQYAVHAQTTGGLRVMADGRTAQHFYAVVETNDPKWTSTQMMASVRFSYSAPTGFTLQAQQEYMSGSSKAVAVICVAPPAAAYAPGIIPGAVYAEASSPMGTVRGHARVEIEIGSGELVVPKPERDWLRAPGKPGKSGTVPPPDTLYLYARIDWPNNCAFTSADSPAVNSTIECKTLGTNANHLALELATPQPDPNYRCWMLQPNSALEPGQVQAPVTVDLGIEGRFMAGLLQKQLQLQVLPAPSLQCEPRAPFLIPDHLTETEVQVTVKGAMSKDQWSLTTEKRAGSEEVVPPPTIKDKDNSVFTATFTLGKLPDNHDTATCQYALMAKEKTGLEAEEVVLAITVTRAGLVVLSKMPATIPGDGKTTVEMELTCIRFKPSADGKGGTIEVDAAALEPKALTFAPDIEAEGAAQRAFRSAAIQITYKTKRGSGLEQRAVYQAQGTAIIPGDGTPHVGKIEISAPVSGTERQDDYTRKLELQLQTVKIPSKAKDYYSEKKLFLQALDELILRPYSATQTARANASQLEWALDWYKSFVTDSEEDQLQRLLDLYNTTKEKIEKETRRDPGVLYDYRFKFYGEVTKLWADIAASQGNLASFCSAGYVIADWTKYISESVFPKIVEIILTEAGVAPWAADLGGSIAGYAQKYVNEYAGQWGAACAEMDPDPWAKADKLTWKKMQDNYVPDLIDIFWGQGEKIVEKRGEIPGLQGPAAAARALKIKAAIYSWFYVYKFSVHWIYDKDENNDNISAADAAKAAAWDVVGKSMADVFEWLVSTDAKVDPGLRARLGGKYDQLRELVNYYSGHGSSGGGHSGGGASSGSDGGSSPTHGSGDPANPTPNTPSTPTPSTPTPSTPTPSTPTPHTPTPITPTPSTPAPSTPTPSTPTPSTPTPHTPTPITPTPSTPAPSTPTPSTPTPSTPTPSTPTPSTPAPSTPPAAPPGSSGHSGYTPE